MKLLLAGGSGFIGQHLVESFSKEFQICTTSRKTFDQSAEIEKIDVDLRYESSIRKFPADIDAIISLIQSPNYRSFPKYTKEVYESSIIANINLANYALKKNIERFIFFSTGSVYENYDMEIKEGNLLAPKSLNGRVKLATESVLELYADKFNLCIFRLFFPYGPGQVDRVIPILVNKIANNDVVTLEGDSGLFFNPTFTPDLTKVLEKALSDRWQGCFNLAGPETVSVRSVASEIGKILDKDVNFRRKSTETKSVIADTDKLYSLIRKSEMTPFNTGIRRTVSCDSTN